MKFYNKVLSFLKFTLLFSALNLFYSCSSLSSGGIAPSFTNAFYAIKGAVFGYPDLQITRQTIEDIPYASALLRIGKGSQGLIILESVAKDEYVWVSRDNVYLVLKDGRIVKTLGLKNNLSEIKSINQTFKDLSSKSQELILNYSTYYSFEDPSLLDLRVNITIINRGLEEIKILGKKKKLILFEENFSNNQIDWKGTNKFWVDPEDYFVWKSSQQISPKLPYFVLEITKKPSN